LNGNGHARYEQIRADLGRKSLYRAGNILSVTVGLNRPDGEALARL
jgi:hypothetical protein